MIENFSDFLSAITIVLIPLMMGVFLIRGLFSTFSKPEEKEEEKLIEYYKEW